MVQQLQDKFLMKDKALFYAFVDLWKAFDRVLKEVVWSGLRRIGVDE